MVNKFFRPNYFEEYDEVEFFTRLRLRKETVRMLLDLIEDIINVIKKPQSRHVFQVETAIDT